MADRKFDAESVEFLQRCFGMPTRERLRIEALRAASVLVAASKPDKMHRPCATTIELAEQFAKWLETGER